MKKLIFVLCVGTILVFASAGFACDCPMPPVLQSFKLADAVFAGEVISVKKSLFGRPSELTIAVGQAFKGVETDRVVVFSAAPEGDCGYHFVPGSAYLFYADKAPGGRLTLSICSRIEGLHSAVAASEIKAIKEYLMGLKKEGVLPTQSDNRFCVLETDCVWTAGLPKKLGGCGCYSKDFVDGVKRDMDKGIYETNNVEFVFCEPPPYFDTICLCNNGKCELNSDPAKARAVDYAKKLCEQAGCKWKDVHIYDEYSSWVIEVDVLSRGGKAYIQIDKETGQVESKRFNLD